MYLGWLIVVFVLLHFPLPRPFPPRRAFNCCVFTAIESAKATYYKTRAVGKGQAPNTPTAEFVVPAGDVIKGIHKALQPQTRLDKHRYGRRVSTVTAATEEVKESRAVAEEVPKAVGGLVAFYRVITG